MRPLAILWMRQHGFWRFTLIQIIFWGSLATCEHTYPVNGHKTLINPVQIRVEAIA